MNRDKPLILLSSCVFSFMSFSGGVNSRAEGGDDKFLAPLRLRYREYPDDDKPMANKAIAASNHGQWGNARGNVHPRKSFGSILAHTRMQETAPAKMIRWYKNLRMARTRSVTITCASTTRHHKPTQKWVGDIASVYHETHMCAKPFVAGIYRIRLQSSSDHMAGAIRPQG